MDLSILFIDSNYMIGETMTELFHKFGYNSYNVTSGLDGIKVCHVVKYDIIVMNYDLPDLTGPELYEELYEINPTAKYLYLTGYTKDRLNYDINKITVVTKPVGFVTLDTIIKDLFI